MKYRPTRKSKNCVIVAGEDDDEDDDDDDDDEEADEDEDYDVGGFLETFFGGTIFNQF